MTHRTAFLSNNCGITTVYHIWLGCCQNIIITIIIIIFITIYLSVCLVYLEGKQNVYQISSAGCIGRAPKMQIGPARPGFACCWTRRAAFGPTTLKRVLRKKNQVYLRRAREEKKNVKVRSYISYIFHFSAILLAWLKKRKRKKKRRKKFERNCKKMTVEKARTGAKSPNGCKKPFLPSFIGKARCKK